MNPRGKSVKRGGLARICMQIRCFHYRSTITEREAERGDEKVRGQRLAVVRRQGGEGRARFFTAERNTSSNLAHTHGARVFLRRRFFPPLLSPGARGSFQPTIVTLVEITSVDVTPAR